MKRTNSPKTRSPRASRSGLGSTRAPARPRLIQCAEQLEGPEEVLRSTYSNSTWQNRPSMPPRRSLAATGRRLADWGLSLGLFGYTEQENH